MPSQDHLRCSKANFGPTAPKLSQDLVQLLCHMPPKGGGDIETICCHLDLPGSCRDTWLRPSHIILGGILPHGDT